MNAKDFMTWARRAALTMIAAVMTTATALATDVVNGVKVIGGDITDVFALRTIFTNLGWKVVDVDLNLNCPDGHDLIYLMYSTGKHGETDNIITDFYVKARNEFVEDSAPETIEFEGRTYHLVPYYGSEAFVNSKGNLNCSVGGDNIRLYYTTDDMPDYRAVTGISFSQENMPGAVEKNGTGETADFNAGAYLLTDGTYNNKIFMYVTTQTKVEQMIGQVKVIGGSKDKVNELKKMYTDEGWTVVDKDLNAGCGSGSDYIYLLYKDTDNAEEGEYITDFYLSSKPGTPPNSITHAGRTYYLASFDGSNNFIDSKGDLNRGAGGDYIHLYYTKDPFPDNRYVFDIFFNNNSDGAVGKDGTAAAYDLNAGCGANTNYIYMHTYQYKILDSWGYGTQDSPFCIRSKAGWDNFAENVNAGKTFEGKYVRLLHDISNVTTMVGTAEHPFRGTFDGEGHTLGVNISASEQGTAPFHYIDGATIQNLNVEGTVSSTSKHAAGLVGFCPGNSTNGNTISNCLVSTNVTVSGADYAGGIVGHGKSSTLTINNCVYGGDISGFKKFAGGLLGWCDAMTLNMDNCLFRGSFTPTADGKYHTIACKGGGSNVNNTVTNTFYLNTILSTATEPNIIDGADGQPVNIEFVNTVWNEPWTAPDGQTYYMHSINTKSLPYYYSFNTPLEEEGWEMAGCIEGTGINDGFFHFEPGNTLPQYLYSPLFDGTTPMKFTFSAVASFIGDPVFYVDYTTSITVNPEYHTKRYALNSSEYWEQGQMTLPMDTRRIRIRPSWLIKLDITNLQFSTNIILEPEQLKVDDMTPEWATFTWEAPKTSIDNKGFNYQYKKKNDGEWSQLMDASTNAARLEDLTPDTDYQLRVRTVYQEQNSEYVSIDFHTPPFMQLPFHNSFENGMDGLEKTESKTSGISPTDRDEIMAHSGQHCFRFMTDGGAQYLSTQFLPQGNAKKLSFYYWSAGCWWTHKFSIGYSTIGADLDTFTWTEDITATNHSEWKRYETTLPANAICAAIRYDLTDTYYFCIDDICVEELSSETAPINLKATDMPEQTATKITWEKPDEAVADYAFQYKKATDKEWTELSATTATAVTLSALDANCDYIFRVQARYDGNRHSNFATVYFQANGGVQQLPFDWSFEEQLGGFRVADNVHETQVVGFKDASRTGKWAFRFSPTVGDADVTPGKTDKPQYLISPRFNANDAIKYTFYYRISTDVSLYMPSAFQVGYSTTTYDIDSFTWSNSMSVIEHGWLHFVGYAPAGTKYIAVKWLPKSYFIMLDDFHFEDISLVDLADDADNNALITKANDKYCHITINNRTLSADGSWNALCLPFNVDNVKGTPLDGFSIKELDTQNPYNGYMTGITDNRLYLNFRDAGSIQAAKPYLVRYNRVKGEDACHLTFTTADGSPSYKGEESGKLVDQNPDTKWCTNVSNKYNGKWYTYFTASNPVKVTGYTLTTAVDTYYNPTRNPVKWELRAKANENDGWITLDSRDVSQNEDDQLPIYDKWAKTYDIPADKQGVYRYFYFIVYKSGGEIMQLGDLQLRGTIEGNTSDITNLSFESLVKAGQPQQVTSQDGKVAFIGNYDPLTVNANDGSVLLLNDNNQVSRPSANTTLNALRAYFQLSNPNAAFNDIILNFGGSQYLLGDVNGDGHVTPADAIMILYHYFNVEQNGFNAAAADLNNDSAITPADAIEALYRYFGK